MIESIDALFVSSKFPSKFVRESFRMPLNNCKCNSLRGCYPCPPQEALVPRGRGWGGSLCSSLAPGTIFLENHFSGVWSLVCKIWCTCDRKPQSGGRIACLIIHIVHLLLAPSGSWFESVSPCWCWLWWSVSLYLEALPHTHYTWKQGGGNIKNCQINTSCWDVSI